MRPDLRSTLRAPSATALLHSRPPLRCYLPRALPWSVLWPHVLRSPDLVFLGSPEASVMLLIGFFPSPPLLSVVTSRQDAEARDLNWGLQGRLRGDVPPVSAGVIIKRRSGEIPCPLAVEAFAAHLSYICKYDDKYSK